jgi:beta-lactamase regulating signal transducer with metallopeptidase domain
MNAFQVVASWQETLVDAPLWAMILLKLTVLLTFAWILHFSLSHANPRWRIVLWRSVAIALISLPVLSFTIPSINWHIPTPSNTTSEISRYVEPTNTNVTETGTPLGTYQADYAASSAVPTAASATEISSQKSSVSNLEIMASIWVVGIILLTIRLIAGWRQISLLTKSAKPAPQWIEDEFQSVASMLNKSVSVDIKLSADISTPLLCGLRRPVLLLPLRMENKSIRGRMPGILSHELSHAVGGDLFWNLCLHLLSIALWFHPLAWRMRAAHSMAGEEISDAVSASMLGDVTTYSRILASEVVDITGPIPAAGIPMARTSEIGHRLKTLKRKVFDMSLQRRSVSAFLAVATTIVVLASATNFIYALEKDTPQDKETQVSENAARKFVRIVIGPEKMTFEGRETTWDKLPALLVAVPDRGHTVLETAVSTGELSVAKFDRAQARVWRLAKPLGFEYSSYIGKHMLGSKGTAGFLGALELNKTIPVGIVAGTTDHANIVTAYSIKFKKEKDQLQATLHCGIISWPKTRWLFTVDLVDDNGKFVASKRQYHENQGIVKGQPGLMTEELLFPLGSLEDASKATRFKISIDQVPRTNKEASAKLDLSTPQATVIGFTRAAAQGKAKLAQSYFLPGGEDFEDVLEVLTASTSSNKYPARVMMESIDLNAPIEIVSAEGDATAMKVVWRVKSAKDFKIEGQEVQKGSTYDFDATLKQVEENWLIDNF